MTEKTFDIKKELKRKGMSVQDLADKLQINRISLSKSLNGNPTVKQLEKIADAIGCEVKDFFNKDENQNS